MRPSNIYLSKLTALFFSIVIIAPFCNEYFFFNWGVNLNLSIYFFIFSSLLLIFFKRSSFILDLELFVYFSILSFLLILSINFDYSVKTYSLLIAIVLSLLMFFKEIASSVKLYLPQFLFFLTFFVLLLILSDFTLVLKSISSNSRMLFDVSPISISIIVCIFILSASVYVKNNIFKIIIFALGLMILMVFKSRGPLLSLGFVTLLLLLQKRKLFLSIFLSVIGFLTMLFISMMREGLAEKSTDGRLIEYSKALSMLSESPFGYSRVGSYQDITGFSFPHNFFLELWVEINIFVPLIITFFSLYLIYIYLSNRIEGRDFVNFPLMLFFLIFIVLQFSISSVEMMRVICPLIFVSYINMKRTL